MPYKKGIDTIMKKDLNFVTKKFRDTLYEKSATAIAVECFMKALPLNMSEPTEMKALAAYATDMYTKLNVGGMLRQALESADSTSDKYRIALAMDTAIESVVKPAIRRVIDDESIYSDDDIFKLNSEEISDFTKARKELEIDDVAEIIKKKVISTIEEEREAHNKNEKIRSDIKEVINKTDDVAVESYMDTILSKNDPRAHISLFSKTIDVCLEAMLYTESKYDTEVPYAILGEITLESKLGGNNTTVHESNIDDVLSYLNAVTVLVDTDPSDYEDKLAVAVKQATICTICIFTLFEVLNSFRIHDIKMVNIQEFLSSSPEIRTIHSNKLKAIVSEVNRAKAELQLMCGKGRIHYSAIIGLYDTLIATKDKIIEIGSKINNGDEITAALSGIDAQLAMINTYREKYGTTENINVSLSYYAKRELEGNSVNLKKYVKMILNNPNVNKVEISFNGSIKTTDSDRAHIEIYGLDKHRAPVANYATQLTLDPAFGNTLKDVVKLLIDHTGINKSQIGLYLTDIQKSELL